MSESTSSKKVSTLARARANVARLQEERIARDKANTQLLEAIFKSQEKIESAEQSRDRAIIAAKEKFQTTVRSAEVSIGENLVELRNNGQSTATLVELTEMSDSEIRSYTKAFRTATKPTDAGGAVPKQEVPRLPAESVPPAELGDGVEVDEPLRSVRSVGE